MKVKFLRAVAAMAAAVLFLSVPISAAPSVSARSAMLMDAATGRVLLEKDADRQSLIASTTKIMTGLLVAEAGNLEREITVPRQAAGVEGSSLYLRQGERLTVETLLYGLLLHSGNDAAVALAMAVSGSVPRFVEKMNRRAAELGLAQTHFANPNGLDDAGNYATARDLAKLAAFAMENETFRQVASTKEIQVGGRNLHNHNKLLWRYDGAEGTKTGFTKKAGRILVSSALREGRRLVAVTINAPDDWRDHAAMLDHGFSQMELQELVTAGQTLGAVPVVGGAATQADCVAAEALAFPLLSGETPELRICLPRFVFAPVQAGDQAGVVQLLLDGKLVAQVPLLWAQDVEAVEPPPGKPSFWRGILFP